jgi:hypothetical protein
MSQYRDDDTANGGFDGEIFVALFRKGAHAYLQNDLLSDAPEHTQTGLSDVADKRIRKTIGRAIRKEKGRWLFRQLPRVVAVLLIVITVCSITVMSVEAFRTPFLNLFVNTEEKKTDIDFDQRETNDESRLADMFAYIPDGYELSLEDHVAQGVTFIYTNESGKAIFIERYNEDGSFSIDTEAAEYNEITIGENQGFYAVKNGETMLVFAKNEFTYFISASMDLSEIIKIAENIQ